MPRIKKISPRQGTAAEWASAHAAGRVLADGELGVVDTDMVIGDGTAAPASLPRLGSATFAGLSAVDLIRSVTRDPRDHGAVFDGVADDGPAINACQAWLSERGGGICQLPGAGVTGIKIDSTVYPTTGVWLRGTGAHTVLTGTANPMIGFPSSGTVVDRWTVSDMLLQSPVGIGVKVDQAGLTGAFQLGWSRGVVERVTVVDAGTDSFYVGAGTVELRVGNCVSARAGGWGFNILGTDGFYGKCTSFGDGTSGSDGGFSVAGGNSKLNICKAYGHVGPGFQFGGAGRHMVTGCESQDNTTYGFDVRGNAAALTGCVSDSDGLAGYRVAGRHTLSGCSQVSGGGGSGQVAPVGVLLAGGNAGSTIDVTASAAIPIGGATDGVSITCNGSAGTQVIPYAASITPDPYAGGTCLIMLTGNVTVANPTKYHRGQLLRLVLDQDATGGRTVTWGSAFAADVVSTTARTTTTVDLQHDGRKWRQVNSQVGAASSVGIADTFARADSSTTLGSTEGATATAWTARAGTWGIASNAAYTTTATAALAIATVTAAADCQVGVTVTAGCDGTSSPMLVFRYADNSNYWYWAPRSAVLRKVVAGVETTTVVTPTGGVAPSNGTRCDVLLVGPAIELLQDGTVIGAWVDATHLTATAHGIGCTAWLNPSLSRFDDFTIT